MSKTFQIFVGYDPRQPVAFHVLAHSVVTRASQPVAMTRLQLNQLPIKRRGLTEFTYSRFLVPYLSDFDGYSLFMDADMLCLSDIWRILDGVDPSAAVSVVMHAEKFERPSLMLFNNKRCRALTPEYVDDVRSPLFDFSWAPRVGTLQRDWNHVVGYNPPNPGARIVHFTKGVPVWPETSGVEWATTWHAEREAMLAEGSFLDLMGPSVHHKK